MKGITNSKPLDTTYELVSLKLVTDLTDHSILNGVAVIVSYEGQVNTYIYDGGVITFYIPPYIEYSISFSEIDNYITPTTQTFIAEAFGNKIEIITYVYNPVKDLSKFDIYGNAISQTTANCYVVSKADTYKIPLVFGNALKNGSTNSAAYTNNGGSYSHNFVDYNGKVVTSPYIETVSGTASSAQLSIADTDGIFTDISIVDGSPCRYLQFKVNSVPATGANGVISIKNSSGVIMWSWHIWVWPDDLSVVEITNSTSVKYNILPVNLGSKWDNESKTKIKNWYYQWGRPTPMLCPAKYNSSTDHANYGEKSYIKTTKADTIGVAIQNPNKFFYNASSPYNWFGSASYYNLWDANCINTGNSDNNVVKTIYDPCPVGFKIPNGNTFTYFSASNVVGSFNNGYYFKRNAEDTTGVFFPASGLRNSNSGGLDYVGSGGRCWCSSSGSKNLACTLSFYSGRVTPKGTSYRAYGFSVRPVQE